MPRAIRREDDAEPFLPQVGDQLGRAGKEARPLPDRPIQVKGETAQVTQRLEDRARPGLSHAIVSLSVSDSPCVAADLLVEQQSLGSPERVYHLIRPCLRMTISVARRAGPGADE